MRYVEASIFFGMLDAELLAFYDKHVAPIRRESPDAAEDAKVWGEEELLCAESFPLGFPVLEGELSGAAGAQKLSPELSQELHVFYMREDQAYRKMWCSFVDAFVERMNVDERRFYDITRSRARGGGWELSVRATHHLRREWSRWVEGAVQFDESQKGLSLQWPEQVQCFKKACLTEGVSFCVSDWIMARPNEEDGDLKKIIPEPPEGLPKYGVPNRMWSGKILHIFRHNRYGGELRKPEALRELVLEVEV